MLTSNKTFETGNEICFWGVGRSLFFRQGMKEMSILMMWKLHFGCLISLIV